jgi:hypothetical protein
MKWFLILTVFNPDMPIDHPERFQTREWFQASQEVCEENVLMIEIRLADLLRGIEEAGASYTLTCEEK